MRGLTTSWRFLHFSSPLLFNFTFFVNLVPLKKHRLSLVEIELFVLLSPALRQYFFVVHYGHSTVKIQRVEIFWRLTIWLNCAEKILLKFLDFNGLFNYGFEFLTFNWLNSTCWIWLLSLWITNLWLWKTKLKNKTWELKLFFDNWNFNLNIFIN